MRSLLRSVLLCVALLLAVAVTCSRAPGLFDGLWEDEVHYNYPVFNTTSMFQLRHDVVPMFKPVLDYALRKWFWFSRFGLAVNERNLALVSLLYSGFSLLLLALWPWTRYPALRLVAVMWLGFCGLETTYSTEAQGYSFITFAVLLLFLLFGAACAWAQRGKFGRSLLCLAIGVFFGLNSHFFSWGMVAICAGLYGLLLGLEPAAGEHRKALLAAALVVLAVLVNRVYDWNHYVIQALLSSPPAPASNHGFHWKAAWPYMTNAWLALGLSTWLFSALALLAALHPERDKRYWGWAAALSVFAGQWALLTAMTMKSSYTIADRYLIMFVPPALFTAALGMESLAARCEALWRPLGQAVTLLCLVFVLVSRADPLRALPAKAAKGMAALRATPANYSSLFQFMERIKGYRRPTLILSNHTWATDIPKLYWRFIGTPPGPAPAQVLETHGNYETSREDLLGGVEKFMTAHRRDGLVVFFNDQDHDDLDPCAFDPRYLYRQPDRKCMAIYQAKDLSPRTFERLGLSVRR